MKYHIKTPNPFYNGKTADVEFVAGIGYTDDEVVRNTLVLEYGYEDVTPEKKQSNKESSDKE